MKTEFNDPLSYYKHLTLFWTDLMYLMANKPASLLSAGPMRNFATNIKKISSEIIEANDDLIEFNTRFLDYYKQLKKRLMKRRLPFQMIQNSWRPTSESGLIFLKLILPSFSILENLVKTMGSL